VLIAQRPTLSEEVVDEFRSRFVIEPLGPAELIGALRADRRVESTADDTSHSHTRTLATT
jgi:hypothetical protein